MDVFKRVKGIMLAPETEWPEIEKEPGTPAWLFTNYVVYLAAIPPIAGFIGGSLIGITVPPDGDLPGAAVRRPARRGDRLSVELRDRLRGVHHHRSARAPVRRTEGFRQRPQGGGLWLHALLGGRHLSAHRGHAVPGLCDRAFRRLSVVARTAAPDE